MVIRSTCPGCGKTVKAGDDWLGRSGKCPGCGTEILFDSPDPPHEAAEAHPAENCKQKGKAGAFVAQSWFSKSTIVVLLSGIAIGYVAGRQQVQTPSTSKQTEDDDSILGSSRRLERAIAQGKSVRSGKANPDAPVIWFSDSEVALAQLAHSADGFDDGLAASEWEQLKEYNLSLPPKEWRISGSPKQQAESLSEWLAATPFIVAEVTLALQKWINEGDATVNQIVTNSHTGAQYRITGSKNSTGASCAIKFVGNLNW